MAHSRSNRTRHALLGLAALTFGVAACGSSGGSSTSSGGTSSSGGVQTVSADSAGLTAARKAIAPYIGHPSPFPVTQALAKRPAKGRKFVFLQCSAPVCAIFAHLLPGPVGAVGGKLITVNAGSSASSAQAAAATALADKPAAVLISATLPQLYGNDLHALDRAGSPVVGGGVVGGAPYGVKESVGGEGSTELAGHLMADWVTVHRGPSANVVFFGTPELTFSPGMQAGFAQTLKQRCPGCKASYQKLSVTTFGTTAPSQVVSYLQAHPSTNTVVFASMEAATGLAATLTDAHLSPTTLGFAPTPSNLQDIRTGGLTAGLALDFNVQVWVQVNAALRVMSGQTTAASNLSVDMEFLTKANVTGTDIQQGWTGYPDVARRFAALWKLHG